MEEEARMRFLVPCGGQASEVVGRSTAAADTWAQSRTTRTRGRHHCRWRRRGCPHPLLPHTARASLLLMTHVLSQQTYLVAWLPQRRGNQESSMRVKFAFGGGLDRLYPKRSIVGREVHEHRPQMSKHGKDLPTASKTLAWAVILELSVGLTHGEWGLHTNRKTHLVPPPGTCGRASNVHPVAARPENITTGAGVGARERGNGDSPLT
uniref:Uncharacterized protein n=1 Tax=Eutreptiella gymnastica TaxID=73025 RepID=A0A7S1N2M4_9EUGL|mmetsp:Transcript_107990/g.186298  ORF Transcript_107990/g.186298 Transcript_107990/m.186298 type:complete len:208 (+) Transcript_107990:160-783(+)